MRFTLAHAEAAPAIGAACTHHLLRHSSCRACVDACPVQALTLAEGRVTLNSERCLHCGDCLFACPVDAISGISTPSRYYRDEALVAPLSRQPASPAELLVWHRLYHIRAVVCDIDQQPGWALAVARLNLLLQQYQEPGWRLIPPARSDVDVVKRTAFHVRESTLRSATVPAGRRVIRQLYPHFSEAVPHIDPQLCQLCGACSRVCPQQALRLTEPFFEIESAQCTDCKRCEDVCPYQALTIETGPRLSTVSQQACFKVRCPNCQRIYAAWENKQAPCAVCRQHQHGMRGNCC